MSAVRVLVIEDDVPLREMLVAALADNGFELDQAENGQQALLFLHEHRHPDVILLDLTMPVMNGWEFRQAQLADPELSSIPVIVMSAVEPGSISADEKLVKPFDLWLLVETVTSVAERGHQTTGDSVGPTAQPASPP